MQTTRFAQLPEGLVAFTATGRGMIDNSMSRAAQQAFGELAPAVQRAGQWDKAASWLAMIPDVPNRPDDPQCRYVAAVLFGYSMAKGEGLGAQPRIELSGTLAWQPVTAGRYAIFTHRGPYAQLHATWTAIYQDWLPTSGLHLLATPPMELMLNDPESTAPQDLATEIWLPVAS